MSFDEKHGCKYIDWFYDGGVKFGNVNGDTVTESFHAFDTGYAFTGEGSTAIDHHTHRNAGILPLLSVGSSHLSHGNFLIGVGHAKIHVDSEAYPYTKGSMIEHFRAQVDGPLKNEHGDKLVRHDAYNSNKGETKGYHYLMYFYFVKLGDKNEVIDMMMSDAFLPIARTGDLAKGYQFTLIFPMSIVKNHGDETSCFISAGYGDYSAVVVELPIEWILQSCRHKVSAVDFNDYAYRFLEFHEDGSVTNRETLGQ